MNKCNKWILFYYTIGNRYRNDPIIIVNGPSLWTIMIKIVFYEKKKTNDLLLFV